MQREIALKQAGNRALAVATSRDPKPATATVLRQIESEAMAFAVAMQGYKLAFIAASLGRSEAYISRIRSGKRPVPEWMVLPFCRVTGTMLLKQWRDWQDSLEAQANPRAAIARLAAQLRAAA